MAMHNPGSVLMMQLLVYDLVLFVQHLLVVICVDLLVQGLLVAIYVDLYMMCWWLFVWTCT